MNSTQLDLWQVELDALPWQGQSPRGLTRGAKVLYSRREPGKDDRFFADARQFDLFVDATRKGPVYAGAPLLVPFGGGYHG